MRHLVPHDLDSTTAKSVAVKALQSYQQRYAAYQPDVSWADDTRANLGFTVKGVTIKGTLNLQPSAFVLDLEVPLLLRVFRKQALAVVESEIKQWVAKAKAGEI